MAAHHVRAGKARAAQFTSSSQRAAAQALLDQRGPKAFYRKYKFVPAGQSGWAIVSRADNTVVRTLGVLPGGAKGG